MAKKSERRILAEAIASQKNIKVKSAMRYLQRIEAPEGRERIKAPRFTGFSESLKRRTRKAAGLVKPRVRKISPVIVPEFFKRISFDYSGTKLLQMSGRVELGSSGSGDIRDRIVKIPVTAAQAERIFNADSLSESLSKFEEIVPYLEDIKEFRFFRFAGQTYENDFFS